MFRSRDEVVSGVREDTRTLTFQKNKKPRCAAHVHTAQCTVESVLYHQNNAV